MQSQHQRRKRGRRQVTAREDAHHRGVYVSAILPDRLERWPRQEAPRRARYPLAHGLVVRVEEESETLVERPVTSIGRGEHEGLEEPGGVRQVPFGGAGVGHGLQLLIFG